MAKPTGTAMERAKDMAATSKAVARQKAETAIQAVSNAFDNKAVIQQITRVTPENLRGSINSEMLLASALMEIKNSKWLQMCTPISVLGSVIKCAGLGLVPNGVLGHAYLTPRQVKNADGVREWTCNMQLGYKGIAHLVYRSDKIIFSCRMPAEGDDFDYDEGLTPFLRYKKKLDRKVPPTWEEFLCGYSVATFPDGRRDFRVLSMADIEKARGCSDSYKRNKAFSPWTLWPEGMGEKTCLVKHSKQLPLSASTIAEIAKDEQREIGHTAQTYKQQGDEIKECEVVDGEVIDATATVEPADEPTQADSGCDHPMAAREDDGSCGACGEVIEPGSHG